MLLDALPTAHQRVLAVGLGQEGLHQRGLSRAGLAGHEHQARLAVPRGAEVAAQRGQLFAPPDDSRAGRGGGRALGGGPRRRRRGEGQPGVLLQDPPLQVAQRGRGIDAELLGQRPAGLLVGGQRLGLAVAAVQREHELAACALAQRLAGDQGLDLPDHLRVAPQGQLGPDPLLEQREVQLLQAPRLAGGEGLGELGERRPAPQGEGLAQAVRGAPGIARGEGLAARPQQLLSPEGVNLRRRDVELVARRARQQDVGRQHLAQLRDVDLHHLGRRVGRLLAPEVIDQAGGRHGPARAQREHGQQSPLLAAS